MDRHVFDQGARIGTQSAVRGRAALSNASGRFESERRHAFDDGWQSGIGPETLATTVVEEHPRRIITRNQSPDVPFDRSINPYRGCEHGCIYCFARPTHGYLGLSSGLDFETRLFVKPDAHRLLEKELRAPNYRIAPIAMGTNTDPYQPIERKWRVTRRILEVLERFGHPVTIVTKSALVTRDIDILESMARRGLARVAVSVTTLDHKLARTMEPRASTPKRRLGALTALSEAGIPAGVMVAPVIPAINDPEIEAILKAAKQAGAVQAGYIPLRLPHDVKDLFRQWLAEHFPDRAGKVMAIVRDMRGGRDNDPNFGSRMRGQGPYAVLLNRRFKLACKKLGLETKNRYWEAPAAASEPTSKLAKSRQLQLF